MHIEKSFFDQKTILQSVDQMSVEKRLLDNLHLIKQPAEKYGIELLENLRDKSKLLFTINRHEEIYSNFTNDINSLFDYLLFRYKFRLSGEKKISFKYPLYILLEPVSTCNLRCPFCFQSDKTFTKKPYMGIMDWNLFTKAVDEANDIGVRAITMGSRGEPTLHKKFGEMLKYISDKKNIFELKTNTNASFLTEKIAHEIFESNVNQIVVSADHYLKKEYELCRVGANFEKILSNVERLHEIREKHYPNSITEIRISGVDANKNLDREAFYNFWIKYADHVTAGNPMERWNTYLNKLHPEINEPCEFLWDRMYVWFDGLVNPCDADYKSYLSFGNLSDESILDVWNSSTLKKHRENHLNNKRNCVDPCNKCGVTF